MHFSALSRHFILRAMLVLLCLVPTTLAVQATPTQIPAGSTAALGSAKAPTADTPQGKILQTALNSDTRDTLQKAMDSADVSPAAR